MADNDTMWLGGADVAGWLQTDNKERRDLQSTYQNQRRNIQVERYQHHLNYCSFFFTKMLVLMNIHLGQHRNQVHSEFAT